MKNKKGFIIGSIIGIIIIALVIIGLLYFTTDLFKTNQQLFYKYMGQIQLGDDNLLKQYNIANEKIQKNNHSSTTEMSFSIANQTQGTEIADAEKENH